MEEEQAADALRLVHEPAGVNGPPTAGDRVPGRYSAWLLRPLIDLGPFEIGPMYAEGVEHAWQALVSPQLPRFALQRTQPSGFRDQLLDHAGRGGWNVADPRDLPAAQRTARWQALCDQLDAWQALDAEARCRLVMLLHGLCLYECVQALVPPLGGRDPRRDDPAAVEAAYWGASSRYMLQMPARFEDYREAPLDDFEAFADGAPQAAITAFNAACKSFTHAAKTGAGLDRLEAAADRMASRLDQAASCLDAFGAGLLASRFHRARAFVPMRRGDRAAVQREMDAAERLARALQPVSAAQRLLAAENLHPVVESRSKEALWAGDEALALSRAREVVELDAHDPKSWVELGQLLAGQARHAQAADAFVTAAMLGPPTAALARHLAGTSLRHAGQEVLAAYFFRGSLEVDPLGISPRAALAVQPSGSAPNSLKDWSGRRFEVVA